MPTVVTIALSVGVKRLLNKKALVRKLSSVETLGSCDMICTDKTGTLTKIRMTVRRGWTPDGEAEVTGSGVTREGALSHPIGLFLFQIVTTCNNAVYSKTGEEWTIVGDPTEVALLVSAIRLAVR